jgi:DNA-binding NarL/FixJ family response regulator
MSDTGKSIVVVIDDHCLRRMALTGLLDHWADTVGLEILQLDDPGALRSIAVDPDACRMCIVNLGARTLEDVKAQVTLSLISTLLPDRPVVAFSDSDSPREIRLAQKNELRGFIPTYMEPRVAIAALNLLLSGGEYFPPIRRLGTDSEGDDKQTADGLSEDRDSPNAARLAQNGHPALTSRQDAVLNGLRQGKSNKQIARELDVSEATVKIHMRQLLRKLGAANRTQAAIIALRGRQQTVEPAVASGQPHDQWPI